MKQLLIYYNPLKNSFYVKYVFNFDKDVGYINQFDHVLVQILDIHKNKFVSSINLYDLSRKIKEIDRIDENSKKNIKNKLIDGAIHLLYKFKK